MVIVVEDSTVMLVEMVVDGGDGREGGVREEGAGIEDSTLLVLPWSTCR